MVEEGRPGGALPGDGAALHQFGEEVGFLFEQALVVGEVVAEERERLDAGAAAEDHLGASAGDRVQGGIALEDADGIVGAEHDHGRAKMDSGRAGGDRGEDDVAGGHREVVGVVLADAEEVDAQLVGKDTFLDDVSDGLGMRERAVLGIVGDVPERVEAEDKRELRCGHCLMPPSPEQPARTRTG